MIIRTVLLLQVRPLRSALGTLLLCGISFSYHLIYPLTAKVVGAPNRDQFPPVFLLSTTLRDLANSRPVHSLMMSFHLFLCLPCLLSPFTVPCKMLLARPDERETQQVDKTYSCYGSRQTLISPSDSLVSDEFSAY